MLCILKIALVTFLLSMQSTNAAGVSAKNAKVVGGSPIAISEAPYQVSVRLKVVDKLDYGFGHICGGSVISQRVVITAAYCLYDSQIYSRFRNASEFTLVMGTDLRNRKDKNTRQYDVQQIVIHPAFNVSTLDNDIALLFINGYIPWNLRTVKAIALPNQSMAPNTACVVTGFGETSESSRSDVLMAGFIPIVSNAECSTVFGSLAAGTICAGLMQTGGVAACWEDYGGPLQCNNVLTGVYTWGEGCGRIGVPGVYTDVFHFNGWIVSNNASLNYSHYNGDASNISGHSKVFMLLVGRLWFWVGESENIDSN